MAKKGWDKLPAASFDGGELFAVLSAKGRDEFITSAIRASGDWERFVHILETDKEKFFEVVKEAYLKRMTKVPQEIQHGMTDSVEELWDKLERAEKATLIEATADVIDAE